MKRITNVDYCAKTQFLSWEYCGVPMWAQGEFQIKDGILYHSFLSPISNKEVSLKHELYDKSYRRVVLNSVLENVAKPFSPAIWRERNVGAIFSSVKEMGMYYNVKNCNYHVEDMEENILRTVNNGRLNGYGNRY